jgi:hypothetical protein
MGKASRTKGARGQSAFANILRDRDYTVAPVSCGVLAEDLIATDCAGVTWSVEVKNTKTITHSAIVQARHQAEKRKARWMLAQHIAGSSSWLVRRQAMRPVVWHERGEDVPE